MYSLGCLFPYYLFPIGLCVVCVCVYSLSLIISAHVWLLSCSFLFWPLPFCISPSLFFNSPSFSLFSSPFLSLTLSLSLPFSLSPLLYSLNVSMDYNKPLIVPVGSDSIGQIGQSVYIIIISYTPLHVHNVLLLLYTSLSFL